MTREAQYNATDYPKTLLLGVQAPYNHTKSIETYFEEFVNLAKTNNIRNYETLFIKIRDIDTSYFLTKGKLNDVKEYCDKHEIEEVVFSEMLTCRQESNLSDFFDCKIFDRTQLILEIFDKAAHSAEGKTQVAIAMLQFQKTRLTGQGIHLDQQAGHRGMRGGFGETTKEKERRHIENTMLKLKRQLEALHHNREIQRKQRINNQIPHICIIGYTNAGKSTILNALTKSNVLAEDKLFATLDTTTRELYINKKKVGVLSDTVGFIQQLPPHLIAAFKSTLSELQYADLLIHVIDLSDPNWESHINVVHQILRDLDIHKEMVYAFNKIDKIPAIETLYGPVSTYQPHVLVSSLNKEGLQSLIEFIATWDSRNKNADSELTPTEQK
ncbi:MAG: GTPase HflX [Candidatus Dependentiae bacterium]|nr:GTPase HflX [Candidatus Dependentiae bacterium]